MTSETTAASDSRPIRVRIAPSPTGDPHVGTAYIGLLNYIFAASAAANSFSASRTPTAPASSPPPSR